MAISEPFEALDWKSEFLLKEIDVLEGSLAPGDSLHTIVKFTSGEPSLQPSQMNSQCQHGCQFLKAAIKKSHLAES